MSFCFFGVGDCGGQTTVKNTLSATQDLITNQDVTDLKKQLNKTITNIVQRDSSACSQNIASDQTVGAAVGGNIGGSINISGVTQSANISANFSCVNITKSMNNIAQKFSNDFSDMISKKLTNNAQDQLNNSNAVSATSQYLSAMPNVNSDSNVKYNLTVKNNMNTNLQTILNNVLEKNLDSSSIQNCIAQISAVQNAGGTVAGNVAGGENITGINQTDSITVLTHCLNNNTSINRTLDKLKSTVNNVVKVAASNTATATQVDTNTTTVKAEGVFSVFTKIGQMFGSMEGILIVLIVVGGIVTVVGGYFYLQSDAGKKQLSGK